MSPDLGSGQGQGYVQSVLGAGNIERETILEYLGRQKRPELLALKILFAYK